ncbi:MAG: site-2 protease family protein [Calditrichia bacterium]
MEFLFLGIIWYAVFLLSATVHEAAHALAALKLGDKTAYHGGQVTLDPVPHVKREVIGTIIVPIISFLVTRGGWMLGWASAPYDPAWAYNFPKRAALMALAGPLSNLLLMFLAAAGIHLGIYLDYFYPPNQIQLTNIVMAHDAGLPTMMAMILSISFILNLLLFLFNLLPFPPLDGSSLFPLFMPKEKALPLMEFLRQPLITGIGLIIAWVLFAEIFTPIHTWALNMLYFMYPGTYQ